MGSGPASRRWRPTCCRRPTREGLDQVSTTLPIVIVHQSSHLATMNSKGLEIAGIAAASPSPEGGVIRRKSGSPEPDGVLEENAFFLSLGKILGKLGPAEGLAILKARTIRAAYQYFEEKRKGSIEVGKLADFVVLDQNPMTIDPMKISGIKVLETIKERKTAYSRAAVPKQSGAPSSCADWEACFNLASHVLTVAGVIDVHQHVD
jgi:predicted amidohydrolase YtcJ